MADFETRVVTPIYIKVKGGRKTRALYRRSRFNFVEYDGSPERYLEPVSACLTFDITGVAGAFDKDRGLSTLPEFYDSNPLSELHDFSDSGL